MKIFDKEALIVTDFTHSPRVKLLTSRYWLKDDKLSKNKLESILHDKS